MISSWQSMSVKKKKKDKQFSQWKISINVRLLNVTLTIDAKFFSFFKTMEFNNHPPKCFVKVQQCTGICSSISKHLNLFWVAMRTFASH